MNIENFNNLDSVVKNIVLGEMLQLYSIITDYPTTVEDLKMFAEWQLPLGKFGKDMKDLLYGLYPAEYSQHTDYTKKDIVRLSNKATYFARRWNVIINNQ